SIRAWACVGLNFGLPMGTGESKINLKCCPEVTAHGRFQLKEPPTSILLLAHRDGRRFDSPPSLSGHCGHGPIFIAQRSVANGRVEMWRGFCRSNISVSAPFVWRCLSGSTMAPFPHPAHRTGRADLPHPALGQDLTPLFGGRRLLQFLNPSWSL